MRHIAELRDIAELVYTDDYSIRALDQQGRNLWTRHFPNMLMQTYYPSNHSFVLIRNVHSVSTGEHSLSEGVNLLAMGDQPIANHVLLAQLFSPTSHIDVPLLDSAHTRVDDYGTSFIPLEEVQELHDTAWPLVAHNNTRFWNASWNTPGGREPRGHRHFSTTQEVVLLLAAVGFTCLLFFLYKWVERWYTRGQKEEKEGSLIAQLPSYPLQPTIPEVSENSVVPPLPAHTDLSVNSASSIPVSSSDIIMHTHSGTEDRSLLSTMETQNETEVSGLSTSSDWMHLNHISLLGVDLPLCTGRYRQDFHVAPPPLSHA